MRNSDQHPSKFPWYGYLGLGLIVIFWYLNWNLEGLRTHWGFFPLWLGYCLFVDAITFSRKGNSLLSRNWLAYMGVYLISAPCWWLFELINIRTKYWIYSGREYFSDLEYFLFASISFSTVLPAVFGTSELIGTFKWDRKIRNWKKIGSESSVKWWFLIAGVIMLVLVQVFPAYGAPFMWISIFFILDPLNLAIGQPSIIGDASKGNWRRLVMLWCGVIVCGFFWEMWNYYSFPKWHYEIPGVDYLHVFEMPLPGFLGYLPFALEVFALYYFILYLFRINKLNDYLDL